MSESAKPTCKFCWILRYFAVVAAVLLGAIAYRSFNPPNLEISELNQQLEAATALPVGFRAVPNVALMGYDGKNKPALSFFEDKWTMVFFGYTYCPDVCPVALSNIAQTMAMVRETNPELADTQTLMVSVDPKRDSPERLKEYVEYFDPAFVGTTGENSDLEELTRGLGAIFAVVGDIESDNYLVDHSSQIVLIDPSGAMRAIMTPPHLPATMASDLALLRANL